MVLMKILTWNIRGVGRQEKRGKIRKIRKILKERNVNLALLQETKRVAISDKEVKALWEGKKIKYMAVDSEGLVGGLFCIWDPKVFQIHDCFSNNRFILLLGTLFNLLNVLY